jgi:phage tail protein X
MQVETSHGTVLDALVLAHYGPAIPASTALEAVFQANPGLSLAGPVLPAGMTILMPVIETPAMAVETGVVRLWGTTCPPGFKSQSALLANRAPAILPA